MKTKEELNNLREEYKELRKKLCALSEEELKEVTGGIPLFDEDYFKQSYNFL